MFYVISGQTDNMTPAQGEVATRKLAAMLSLHGLQPRHAIGAFEGKSEYSLVVPVYELEHHSVVLNMARSYEQKCVLAVDAFNTASLLPTNPDLPGEELGEWVCKGTSAPEGDCTYVAGLYYACE